jgi:hypothetical protein
LTGGAHTHSCAAVSAEQADTAGSGGAFATSGSTGSGGGVAVTGSTANTGSGTAKTIDTVPAYEKVMFIIKT